MKRNRSTYFGIALIVLFLTLEAGSRIWLHFLASPDQKQICAYSSDLESGDFPWTKHHYLNYYPTPNYRRGMTSHNALGFRDREFLLKKPTDVYRIAVIGGSAVYSPRIEDNDKTFTAQLEKILWDNYGYKNVEVINAGVGGYSSWESLINLETRVLDMAPDLVIAYLGSEDVHARLVSPGAYHGDNSGSRKPWEPPAGRLFEKSSLLRVVSRLFGFTDQLHVQSFIASADYQGACSVDYDQILSDAYARELLKSNPPVYFRRNLLSIGAVAEVHNVKIMFATWAYSPYFEGYASTPHYQRGFVEINAIIREVASMGGIHLFDYAQVMTTDKKYWADGRHVNEEGALLKAGLFADFIHASRFIPR